MVEKEETFASAFTALVARPFVSTVLALGSVEGRGTSGGGGISLGGGSRSSSKSLQNLDRGSVVGGGRSNSVSFVVVGSIDGGGPSGGGGNMESEIVSAGCGAGGSVFSTAVLVVVVCAASSLSSTAKLGILEMLLL